MSRFDYLPSDVEDSPEDIVRSYGASVPAPKLAAHIGLYIAVIAILGGTAAGLAWSVWQIVFGGM